MGDKTNLKFVLFFTCPLEVCSYALLQNSIKKVQSIVGAIVCIDDMNSLAIIVIYIYYSVWYHVTHLFMPQVCTQRCLDRGAAGSGRTDDNIESLKKRFDTYMNATMPIIEHYESKGLVRTIDATKDVEEIFDEVSKLFA